MSKSEQEVEVKFPVRNLDAIARRLQAEGAGLIAARVLEINLRFDTPDRALTRVHRVLRLRQDAGAVMTYKGPADYEAGVSSRREIEFQVSDFSAARTLLEELGYEVSVMYEKYRTTYSLDGLIVVLDEMPIGNFIEIEGPGADRIAETATRLGLDWSARSTASYLALFNGLVARLGLAVKNLSFTEFKDIQVKMEDMDLRYAD